MPLAAGQIGQGSIEGLVADLPEVVYKQAGPDSPHSSRPTLLEDCSHFVRVLGVLALASVLAAAADRYYWQIVRRWPRAHRVGIAEALAEGVAAVHAEVAVVVDY